MRALHIIDPRGVRSAVAYQGRQAPLELIQHHVGGMVEHIRVKYHGRWRDAYVNESGVLEGLEFNPAATALGAERGYGPLVGTIVIDLPRGEP